MSSTLAGHLPLTVYALRREGTGRPKRRRETQELTWQAIIRENADFPGAFLRYFRSLGMPA